MKGTIVDGGPPSSASSGFRPPPWRSGAGLWGVFFFLAPFALYLHTAAPWVAAYRDAGEMASVLHGFGVAHAPGYPLYAIVGQVIRLFGAGNDAYRCNVLSAAAAAGTLSLLFLVLRRLVGTGGASVAAAFLAFSNPFWDLATVSEMYTLGAALLVAAFGAALLAERPLLAAYLFGLGLGVRMDFLLLAPVLALALGRRRPTEWIACAAAAALGASVFLYLPVRSLRDPLIDWSNPETLGALFASVTRKSYSGTLDLLSLSYRFGENFDAGLRFFAGHLWRSFGPAGLALLALGAMALWRDHRRLFWSAAGIGVLSGPIFLLLANMPPNPHALAIVEASFVTPDVAVALFIAGGAAWIARRRDALLMVLLPFLAFQASAGWVRANKREQYFARDFVTSLSRELPEGAVAVFQKDVQLFSFWAAALIDGRRPDLGILSQGLSASPWYEAMLARWPGRPARSADLKSPTGWVALLDANPGREVAIGADVVFAGAPGVVLAPAGAINRLVPAGAHPAGDRPPFEEVGVFRGRYRYGETPDFFSTDLIGDQARGFRVQGLAALDANDLARADGAFRLAELFDPTAAQPTADRAYLRYVVGRWAESEALYRRAARKNEESLKETVRYRSLPDAVAGVRREAADIQTHMGVLEERQGRVEAARDRYEAALRLAPDPQAHFNLGATYWGHDWTRAAQEFDAALALRPDWAEALRFRDAARLKAAGR